MFLCLLQVEKGVIVAAGATGATFKCFLMLCLPQVEKGAMVAAGAVVEPGTVIPAGQIWGGSPAKYLRDLQPDERK